MHRLNIRLFRLSSAATLAFAVLPAGGAVQAAAQSADVTAAASRQIDTLAIRAHTRFLADDELAGRGTGTRGERIAAAYIASQLQRLGLKPFGGDSTFLLPLPLRAARIDPASTITVDVRGDTTVFRSGVDFILNTGGANAFRSFSGGAIVFPQPNLALPFLGEGSLEGRVAVFIGALGGNAVEVIPALIRAGAAGVVVLVTDARMYDLYARSRGSVRYFVDAPVDDPVWQPDLPVILAGPRMSDIVMDAGSVPAGLPQGLGAEGVDLRRTITADIRTTTESVPAANVGAVLTGSDPSLRDEYVVYTAHYDHLGVSTPDARGDSIYNGFSDNAAGVAMLLSIAQALRDAPLARSAAFLFLTGEERGLLGSSYVATEPPLPLENITALINLDAGAPPAPPITWRIAGGTASPLGALAAQVAEQRGWTAALSDASPNSDYWPFLRRGVPSIFIIPGDQWENVAPPQRDALRARWDRYHQAGDHWHAEFPFSGLERYAAFALAVGVAAGSR